MDKHLNAFIKAKQLHKDGKVKEAQKIYLKLLSKIKNNFQLYFLLGTSFLQTKEYNKAIFFLEISEKINSNFADTYNNKGVAYAELNKYEDALINYNRALKLNSNFFDALLNKGIALKNLKRYENSRKILEEAINLNPQKPETYNTIGNILKEQSKFKEATNFYTKALSLNSNYAEAYNNRGIVLNSLKKFTEANEDYHKTVSINENINYLLGNMLHNKMFLCDWKNFDLILDKIREKILLKENVIDPYILLTLIDDPKLHKLNSQIFLNRYLKSNKKNKQITNKKNDKIKIGYFSADLHKHPILFLMFDVFKNHNKSKFEIYAFSHGYEKEDNFTDSIKPFFNKFYDISKKNSDEINEITQNINLDIAINLTGLTANHRTDIFVKRVAPIQINYLGYPGTINNKSIDYILTDRVVIPDNFKKNYSEKILYLPNCYQPSSNELFKLNHNHKEIKRSDFDLPDNEVVFCSFNNTFKILPSVFNSWMNILSKVEKSILWIFVQDEMAKNNLRKEAEKKGVDPKRIKFAEKIDNVEKHLKRIQLADIFLDTFPYNAHTTANDCIKMGLPIITIMGKSFASRVAGSILNTINMPELITNKLKDYEDLAIQLGNDKTKLVNIKRKIKSNSKKSLFFDSKKFTENLENIYTRLVK